MYAPYKDKPVSEPRTFTPDLAGLIAWLETQDGATEYDSSNPFDCLFARFHKAIGWRAVTGILAPAPQEETCLCWMYQSANEIAYRHPQTYAAAAERAKSAAKFYHTSKGES